MRRQIKIPTPSKQQEQALERLVAGIGTEADVKDVKRLCNECGEYGCVYTALSRTSRTMPACPGWCDALEAHKNFIKKRTSIYKQELPIKPRKLGRIEKRTLAHISNGIVTTTDLYTIELLAYECTQDGCVLENPTCNPLSKITTCPGWCTLAAKTWMNWLELQ